ncbi:hypothetical protein DPMN_140319 [Dreissena polymorpha]|uniref:Ig-like domain-containing protein n=1 Tax=Dreissena polymorpha TaxID=45954 RepID=A0A9D4G7Y1_DREPO|nr:hypothetical protein DPMN_140319 [Dreissena polymorpha]
MKLVLSVFNFTINEAGKYECIVLNTGNKSSVNISKIDPVKTVSMSPRIGTVSLLENVKTGLFYCSSYGRPTPKIRWYLDDLTVNFTDDIEMTYYATVTTSGDIAISQLVFTPIEEYHGMKLYCNATNKFRYKASTGHFAIPHYPCHVPKWKPS